MLEITSEPVPLAQDSDGVFRVAGTRVALDSVVAAFLEGATAEEIVQQYPSLNLADVYSVLGYYLRWQPQVEAYLRHRRDHADIICQQNEERFNPAGLRARLIARRHQQNH